MIQDENNTQTESVYAARLRAAHDPRDNIQKIEEEVMEEMAGALGRTADKANYKFLVLERKGQEVDALVEAKANSAEIEKAIGDFNRLRDDAEDARRELMIHRQALGFKTGNHALVSDMWPLPPKRALQTGNNGNEPEIADVGTGAEEIAARQREWLRNMERLSRR